MTWHDIPPERRAHVVGLLRQVAGLGPLTRGPLQLHDDAEAAVDALEDIAALQDLEATKARIRREVAIEAADRCYQRAISRMAQIKIEPDARQYLTDKALEARASGDDIMKAAGLHPKEHPRDPQMRKRLPGVILDVIKYPEFGDKS